MLNWEYLHKCIIFLFFYSNYLEQVIVHYKINELKHRFKYELRAA